MTPSSARRPWRRWSKRARWRASSPDRGAIFFGLVVVLTMLAAESFDPRLIWDRLGARRG
jgi:uncharacterized paraquat-inducible protein A